MVKRYIFSVYSILLVIFFISCGLISKKSNMQTAGQYPQVFEKGITRTVTVQYLLFLPKEYYKDRREWPLMLFLHGGGERGSDLELVKTHGPPKMVEEWEDFPFILVSPQCPKQEWWSDEVLNALIDEVIKKYRVDEDRIYLTGLSMGGLGSWTLAVAYPDRFAAILAICPARSLPDKACRIKDIPIWIFHNTKDNRIPIQRSEEMVEALKECGADVKFTVYKEPYYTEHLHDAWTETYNNPEVYEWFLSHRRVKSD